ncbi:phosphotransferase [Vibrio sp. S4M6]|uniref:phosphotransferase family protein n=1 Tax=Vibrio sinus TaxID=2946865 RepID=UPI00202A0057|nr:phosphotransferase [Vibrio sinus]MCL9783454.1 phosphotransferase [Vibrio sinus]
MPLQDLSKMGASRVLLQEYEGNLCINKQKASAVEIGFYQFSAPKLTGVNTPKLIRLNGNNLYIEYIPNKITLDKLNKCDDTFRQLAYLHQSKCTPPFAVKTHQWTLEATELALQSLNLPNVTRDSIYTIQASSAELFVSHGLISGDSNDGNWGVRDNEELVLFDWERFGYGSPAIDLAPLVRGLGSVSSYREVVEKYSCFNPTFSSEILRKHLIIAKVWILIEVTNILISRNKQDAQLYLSWFNENAPSWLDVIEKEL